MIVQKKSRYNVRVLLDLLLLNTSFLFAAVLAQSFTVLIERNYMFILLLLLNILWYFGSNIIVYYEDFSSRYFSYQFINIIKSVLLQVVTSVLFIFIAKEELFTRYFIFYYSIILTVTLSLRTILFKAVLRALRMRGKITRNMLIVGTGDVGSSFYEIINDNPDFGYNFIGFVDSRTETTVNDKVLGSISDLDAIIQENKINEAVIALPNSEFEIIDNIIKVCNKNAVRTHIIPDYFKFLSKKFRIGMIGDFPIITVRNEPLEEIQWRFFKRSMDLAASIIIIALIASWLFPLIAILQKLTSKGPVFFVQDRIGKGNKIFRCYKFRTMIVSTDQFQFSPVIERDFRITRFGNFLRRSNLDELPQIINVFFGDMSLVGPRPHAIVYNETYKEFVEEIKLRQLVKPGITGWAQIHGLRGDVIDEEENRVRTKKRIEFDLWYIENWSFWLDVQIILLTLWQMIKGNAMGY